MLHCRLVGRMFVSVVVSMARGHGRGGEVYFASLDCVASSLFGSSKREHTVAKILDRIL